MDLFELLGKVRIDNSKAHDELDKTSRKGRETQNKLSGFFSAMGKGAATAGKAIAGGMAVAGAAMGALTIKALTLTGELEQNMGGSEAVFGEHAAQMQKIARDAFANMGLSTSSYLATANKMGALFQGVGFDVKQSMELSSAAMQRAADVASIMGIDVEFAMESIAGAAKGNFEMMDNLGVAINDTALQAYALEKGITKSTTAMTTQEKVGLAMELFLEKTAYATGNYAKENETLAGALETTKAALVNFLDGSGDVEDFIASFENLASVVVRSLTEIAPRLVEGLTRAFNELIPMLPSLVGSLLPALIEGATQLIEGLVAAMPELISVLMKSLPDIIKGIQNIVNRIIKSLPDIIKPILDALPTLIPDLVDALTSMVVTLCTELPDIIMPIIEHLPEIIQSIVDSLMDNLPILIEGLVQLVVGVVENMPTIIQGLIDEIPNIIQSVVKALWEALPTLIMAVGQMVLSIFQSIADSLWNAIKSMFGWIIDLWNWICDVMGWSSKKVTLSAQEAAAGMKSAFNSVNPAVRSVANNMISVFQNVASQTRGIMSSLASSIASTLQTIGNSSFTGSLMATIKAKLPKMATGGIVNRPTFAQIGEDGREAVVPLEKNTGWIRQIAGQLHEYSLDMRHQFEGVYSVQPTGIQPPAPELQSLNEKMTVIITFLGQYFPQMLEQMNQAVVLDDGTLVGRMAPAMDEELGRLAAQKERGQ